MIKMSKWLKIYKKQMNQFSDIDTFIKKRILYKKKLIAKIREYTNNNGMILETGCGSGITSIYLSKFRYDVTGIDNDKEMLSLAQEISDISNSKAKFKEMDLKKLKFEDKKFDVIFSNGVLEHFSDQEIIKIINHHLKFTKYIIFSIPSSQFTEDQKIFGDERFMTYQQWESILRKTKGEIIENFGFVYEKRNKNNLNNAKFMGFVVKCKTNMY